MKQMPDRPEGPETPSPFTEQGSKGRRLDCITGKRTGGISRRPTATRIHLLWFRQVFWLSRLCSGLPIIRMNNSGINVLQRFPKKGGITAAGPLPIFTGFPIKPIGRLALWVFFSGLGGCCQLLTALHQHNYPCYVNLAGCLPETWGELPSGF
jgi:hypothetical protein